MFKNKNLVYVAVYGKRDYIKLFNLLLASIFLSKIERNRFSLLVMTSPSLKDEILRTISSIDFGVEILVWDNEEKPDVFQASFARYQIFEFKQINHFEKILYLDVDVLINGDLSDIFLHNLEKEVIYCLPEGELKIDKFDHYGRSLFIENGFQQFLTEPGFTAGVILFKNSSVVKSTFEEVLKLGFEEKIKGRVFSCYDQPFLNFLATSRNLINLEILPKYMVNNPANSLGRFAINHFPGGPGNFGSKFSKMSKFFLDLIRQRLPNYLWSIVLNCMFSSEKINGKILRLDDKVFFAELSDKTTGFIISTPESRNGLFVAVPSFEIYSIRLRSDINQLNIQKPRRRNILNDEYLDSITSNIDKSPDVKRRLKDKINLDVFNFLKFSYANKKSVMWHGGTIDDTEFSALVSLAQEASKFSGPIIEIGTLFGFSTNALAIGKASHTKLITVDAFTWNPIGIPAWRHEELTKKSLSYLIDKQNVILVKSDADSFYRSYDDGQPSMVFIDADHSYESVLKDIRFAQRAGAKIICGDDFSWPGVEKAVEETFGGNYQLVGDMWIARQT